MALGIAQQKRRMNVSPGGVMPAKLRLALAPKRPSDAPPFPGALDDRRRSEAVASLYDAQIQCQISGAVKRREIDMRHMMFAIVAAAAVGLIGIAGASAAPANGHAISQTTDHSSYVTDVAEGCGRGWHRNRWGHCVP
jgi:hypothetical protein